MRRNRKRNVCAHRARCMRGDCVSTAAFLQINFIPAIALLMMRHNTRQTLSFSWRTRVLRTECCCLALLFICTVQRFCAISKNGLVKDFVKGWGCGMRRLLACAYLCFLYAGCGAGRNGQRGIKCWILAIPALIGSAVLLSNPWTRRSILSIWRTL